MWSDGFTKVADVCGSQGRWNTSEDLHTWSESTEYQASGMQCLVVGRAGGGYLQEGARDKLVDHSFVVKLGELLWEDEGEEVAMEVKLKLRTSCCEEWLMQSDELVLWLYEKMNAGQGLLGWLLMFKQGVEDFSRDFDHCDVDVVSREGCAS